MAFHAFGAKALDATAAIASVLGYLPIGSTDLDEASVTPTQIAHLYQALSPSQRDYINDRAGLHDLSGVDVLLKVPASVADSPHQATELIKQSQISHILSQDTHPHLASDPNNIVLEVASDYTNQARGASPMSAEDLNTVNERLNQVAGDINSDFDVDGTFNGFCGYATATSGVFAGMRRLTPDHFNRFKRLFHQIIVHGPRLHREEDRQQLLTAIQTFVAENLGDENSWAALLIGLLVWKCPWALALIGARGLCTLAKAGCVALKHLLLSAPDVPVIKQLTAVMGFALDVAIVLLDLAIAALSSVIHWIEQGCRFAGRLIVLAGQILKAAAHAFKPIVDVVVTAIKAVAPIVKAVYQGVKHAFSSFCNWLFGGHSSAFA